MCLPCVVRGTRYNCDGRNLYGSGAAEFREVQSAGEGMTKGGPENRGRLWKAGVSSGESAGCAVRFREKMQGDRIEDQVPGALCDFVE